MSEKAPRRPRRWRRRILSGLGVLVLIVLLLVVAANVYRGCLRTSLPEDAPRIGLALDDFWFNRTGLVSSAFDVSISRAGGRLVELDYRTAGDPLDPARMARILEGVDGLILGGGGSVDPDLYGADREEGEPADRLCDEFALEMIRQAKTRRIPLVAICRGCEILNVACGGTLKTLDPEGRARHFLPRQGHDLFVEPGGRLAEILGRTRFEGVLSTHLMGLDRLGRNVRAVAWADEDRREIEAIEITDADWIFGVLWHPEREILTDEIHLPLFRSLVDEARRRKASDPP
jgi:putative glutamine amidotransferase